MTSKEAHEAWQRAEDELERQRRRMTEALAALRAAARSEVAAMAERDAAFKAWSDAESAEHAGSVAP